MLEYTSSGMLRLLRRSYDRDRGHAGSPCGCSMLVCDRVADFCFAHCTQSSNSDFI
jgi:hypothetical protein